MDATDTTVTIAWIPPDPPNGIIIQYQVQYRRNDGNDDSFSDNEVNITATDLTDLTYTVTRLMTATQYRFRVRASTIVGRGDSSNFVNFFVGKLIIYQVYKNQLCPHIKIATFSQMYICCHIPHSGFANQIKIITLVKKFMENLMKLMEWDYDF